MNATSEKYTNYGGENSGNYDDVYKSFIMQEISKYTMEDLKENKTLGQDEIRDDLNSHFGDSSFIISVEGFGRIIEELKVFNTEFVII